MEERAATMIQIFIVSCGAFSDGELKTCIADDVASLSVCAYAGKMSLFL